MTTKKLPQLCKGINCSAIATRKGYCTRHYTRVRRYGDAEYCKKPQSVTPQSICSIEGCDGVAVGRTYCNKHLLRFYAYGDPLSFGRGYGYGDTVEERFWSRVDKSEGLGRDGDCWEWVGSHAKAYGRIMIDGKSWGTHRYSFFLANGYDATQYVLHSCDNPKCVNPEHLRDGSPKENTQDAVQRGRMQKGESRPFSKLTEQDVRYIRQRWDGKRGLQTKLSQEFNVTRTTIRLIIRGDAWKHVT